MPRGGCGREKRGTKAEKKDKVEVREREMEGVELPEGGPEGGVVDMKLGCETVT